MATPRIVVVTRPSDYESLLARHGTREQARFFLSTRGQDIAVAEHGDAEQHAAEAVISRAIPSQVRRSNVTRSDLSRFLFEPDDIVVCIGQDGLVANVAKYLAGQLVIGILPGKRTDGVLARHEAAAARGLLATALAGKVKVEERTMVEAVTDDGVRLLALNEIFAGHRTHQSARYRVRKDDVVEERQSSSGVIVATGTGATGWARSISLGRIACPELPKPCDPGLVFFVREAFPSGTTGTKVVAGLVDGASPLALVSEMNEGGTIFGDGIEDDAVDFRWGLSATIRPAKERLRLVI